MERAEISVASEECVGRARATDGDVKKPPAAASQSGWGEGDLEGTESVRGWREERVDGRVGLWGSVGGDVAKVRGRIWGEDGGRERQNSRAGAVASGDELS